MSGVGRWIAENWFNLISAAGIIASLLFTGASLSSETKTRRVANLLTLTKNHRELWSELFNHPRLLRVIDPTVDLHKDPTTLEENYFVNMVIQHMNSAFEALNGGLVIKAEGMSRDVRWFLSLPIPKEVWLKLKPLQNNDFVKFIEECLDPHARAS